MELPRAIKDLSWEKMFAAALVLFILFGFATKLVASATMDLNSDMVGMGLLSMEIGKHGNYLLSGYILPSDDTFIFTELVPFQLIPQVLTGYDPMALRLVSFAIFALAVIVLSYVIFLVTGEAACALVFAALAANLPPESYDFFRIPTTHIATIVFMGAILALLLYVKNKEKAAGDPGLKRKKRAVTRRKVEWPHIALLAVLVAMTVLSDSIILTWLIIPFVAAYLLFARGRSPTMDLAVASMVVVSLLSYVFKSYFVPDWIRQSIISLGQVAVNLPLSYKSLAINLNPGLYRALDGFSGFGYLDAISLAVFILVVAYAVKQAVADKDRRFFYGILLFSAVLMFGSFLANSLVKDLSQARYFTFTGLSVFMLVAAAYRKGDKIFGGLVIVLLLLSAAYGFSSLSAASHQPNAEQYGLIDFMKGHNLSFGYSTYWNANLITYLSGEDVTVRDTFFYRDGLEPNTWLGCERWYLSPPEKAFLLVDNSTLSADSRNAVEALAGTLNASEPLSYGKYLIYPTNARAF